MFWTNVLLHAYRRNRRRAKLREAASPVKGVVCPRCQRPLLYRAGDNEYVCRGCGQRAGFTARGGRIQFGGKP